ncbi:MAG: L-threonylcarbamoyladenylate synthase, partial [Desulfovibrionales bacterium]
MEDMERVALIVREGGMVIYPTETLYALGGDGLNRSTVEAIARLKGRPP